MQLALRRPKDLAVPCLGMSGYEREVIGDGWYVWNMYKGALHMMYDNDLFIDISGGHKSEITEVPSWVLKIIGLEISKPWNLAEHWKQWISYPRETMMKRPLTPWPFPSSFLPRSRADLQVALSQDAFRTVWSSAWTNPWSKTYRKEMHVLMCLIT